MGIDMNKKLFVGFIIATIMIISSFAILFSNTNNSLINVNKITPNITNSTYSQNIDWQNFTLPAFPNLLYSSNGADTVNNGIYSAGNNPFHQDGFFYINASWDLVFYNIQLNSTILLHKFNNDIISSWSYDRNNEAGLMMYQNRNGSIQYLYIFGNNVSNSNGYFEAYNLYNNTYETYVVTSPYAEYGSFFIFDSQGYFIWNSNSATQNYIGNIYDHTANGLITTDPFTATVTGNTLSYIADLNEFICYGLASNNSLEISLNYFNPATLGHYNRIMYYALPSQNSTNDGNNPITFRVLSNGTIDVLGYMQYNNIDTLAFTLNMNTNISKATIKYVNYTSYRALELTNQPTYSQSGNVLAMSEMTAIAGNNPNNAIYNYSQNNIIKPTNTWLLNQLAINRMGYSISTTVDTSDIYTANANGYRYTYGNEPVSYYESETPNNNTQFMLMWFPKYTSEFNNINLKYNVNIIENGLPSNTQWTYTFNGTQNSTTSSSFNLSEPNGTYSFSVNTISGYIVNYPTSIIVNGNNIIEYVNFTSIPTYNLQIKENGLTYGVQWGYTFNSHSYTLTNNSYNYSLPNGTYSLSVNTKSGYNINYASSITISGSNIIEYVNFTTIPTYKLIIKETGLNSGTSWIIYLNSNQYTSTSNYDNITGLVNGTYTFSANNINGYYLANYPTSVLINGNNAYINLSFSKNTSLYSATFIETGIKDVTSIQWSIIFNGTIYKSTNSNTIIVPSLVNKTYSYSINSVPGYVINSYTNSVIINGKNVSVDISFNLTYKVIIKETGYNSEWYAVFNGLSYNSFNTYINITTINGTYSLDIPAITGYSVSSYSSTVTINGNNYYLNLTFTKVKITQGYYIVEFIVSGLTKGNNFTVIINNQQYVSTNNMYLNITLTNGTYTPFIELPNNYVLSQPTNTLVVNGNNTVYAIYTNYQFNIWVYTPEFVIAIIFIGLVILGAYLKRAI